MHRERSEEKGWKETGTVAHPGLGMEVASCSTNESVNSRVKAKNGVTKISESDFYMFFTHQITGNHKFCGVTH